MVLPLDSTTFWPQDESGCPLAAARPCSLVDLKEYPIIEEWSGIARLHGAVFPLSSEQAPIPKRTVPPDGGPLFMPCATRCLHALSVVSTQTSSAAIAPSDMNDCEKQRLELESIAAIPTTKPKKAKKRLRELEEPRRKRKQQEQEVEGSEIMLGMSDVKLLCTEKAMKQAKMYKQYNTIFNRRVVYSPETVLSGNCQPCKSRDPYQIEVPISSWCRGSRVLTLSPTTDYFPARTYRALESALVEVEILLNETVNGASILSLW